MANKTEELAENIINCCKHGSGDVNHVSGYEFLGCDLLIGGSPCQGFSFAGKQLNFEDPRSKLFFEFVNIVNHYKPRYFLLENVKMKKEYQDIISGDFMRRAQAEKLLPQKK